MLVILSRAFLEFWNLAGTNNSRLSSKIPIHDSKFQRDSKSQTSAYPEVLNNFLVPRQRAYIRARRHITGIKGPKKTRKPRGLRVSRLFD